jgi:N-acetylglucosamine-6-phosphate deacetylase
MNKKTLKGKILSGQHWIDGQIEFDQKILSISGSILADEPTEGPFIIPGFIDLHVHGAAGVDFMAGGDAIHKIAASHIKYGTTAFLPTTMTAPREEIEKAIRDASHHLQTVSNAKTAKPLGIHLEGPYISDKKLGAQPNFTSTCSLADVQHWHSLMKIRTLTMAPEVEDNIAAIEALSKMGIIIQLGHSNATYEQSLAAIKKGANSFTHLFNAMSSFHHREPGMAGAALAHGEFAEIIPDLLHVHPGALKVALRALPKLYVVTDSTSATGMPDGEYRLGQHQVTKCLGGVRLKDGTLAGSCLTMIEAYQNLLTLGQSKAQSSQRLSQYPAELIKEAYRGVLKQNNFADILILDNHSKLLSVFSEGVEI